MVIQAFRTRLELIIDLEAGLSPHDVACAEMYPLPITGVVILKTNEPDHVPVDAGPPDIQGSAIKINVQTYVPHAS